MRELPEPVVKYIEAYNRKDVEGMLRQLSNDVTFLNISNGEQTAEALNKDAFRELAMASIAAFDSRSQNVVKSVTVADIVAVEIEYSAVVATDMPNGWTKGQRVSLVGASLFQLRDDKIARIVDES